MQQTDVLTQALGILAATLAKGVNVVQGVAGKVLADVVAGWLRAHGYETAWTDYSRNPGNDSLVRHLLSQAVQQDADFRAALERAVAAAVAARPAQAGPQQIMNNGSGDAQVGNRGDVVSAGRVATRGGTYNETHNRNSRVTNKKTSPGAYLAVGIVVLVLLGLLVKGIGSVVNHGSGLTASSTCQQFLNADDQTEQQALVDIAASKGIGGFGSPLALPEIRYECSYQPVMTLGSLIEKDRTEFG